MNVSVIYGHQIFYVALRDDSTVFNLKRLLGRALDLPVENQLLDYGDIILSNHTPLQAYQIDPNELILLRDLYEIFFEADSADGHGIRRFRLLVHQNNKLRELKNMLHLHHGFAIGDTMTLRVESPFGPVYANDDHRDIYEYQIFTGTVIRILQ